MKTMILLSAFIASIAQAQSHNFVLKNQADPKLQQKSSLSDAAKFRSDLTKFNPSAANLRPIQMNANAFRGGSEGTGGGDLKCAAQITQILSRFAEWFDGDGPRKAGLDISGVQGLTYDELNKAVTPWLVEGAIVPVCLNPRDVKEHPKAYTNEAKQFADLLTKYNKICFYAPTAKGKDSHGNEIARFKIACDSTQMTAIASGDKATAGLEFEQIGHELLGIAKIENKNNTNDLQVSSYPISPKFRSFLTEFTDYQLTFDSAVSSAEVITEPNGTLSPEISLKLAGGKGGIAEELYVDLKSKYQTDWSSEPQVIGTSMGGKVLYATRYLKAIANEEETHFEVTLKMNDVGGKVVTPENLQADIHKGVFDISNDDLSPILKPSSDDSSYPTTVGKFIRCKGRFVCEVHLKTTIPKAKAIAAKNCEFSVNRIATLETPNIKREGDGYYAESVLLVVQVKPEFRDKVAAVHFGGQPMDLVGNGSVEGFYQIELPTTGIQDGPGSLSNLGYFRLDLIDGRIFTIRPKNGNVFNIDQNFAMHNTAKIKTTFRSDDIISIKKLNSTAELYDKDGSARYINPYRCL